MTKTDTSLDMEKCVSMGCKTNYEGPAKQVKRLQSDEFMAATGRKRIKSESGSCGSIDIIPPNKEFKNIESAAKVDNSFASTRVGDCDDSDCEVVVLGVVHPSVSTILPTATATSNAKREIRDGPTLGKDDEVEIVGEINTTYLPHNRQDCLECQINNDGGNSSFCKLCYCFVCDKLASECKNWIDTSDPENYHKNHCNATDKGPEGTPWKNLRAINREASKYHQQCQRIHRCVERTDGPTSSETNRGAIRIEDTGPGGVDHGYVWRQRICQCSNCQQAQLRYYQIAQTPSRLGHNTPLHWHPYPGFNPVCRNPRSHSYPSPTPDGLPQFEGQVLPHPFLNRSMPVSSPQQDHVSAYPLQNAPTNDVPQPYYCSNVLPFRLDQNRDVYHMRSNNPLQSEMTSTFPRNNNFPINGLFIQTPYANGPVSSYLLDVGHYFPNPPSTHPQYFGHRHY